MTKRKPSKLEKSLAAGKKFSELTHREWYWWSRAFTKKARPGCVHTASIRHACVCRCCKDSHKRKTVVKIHATTHKRALDIAYALFFVGRPSIQAKDIDMIEVRSPDCSTTDIHRLPNGEIKFGYTMLSGSIKELAAAGHVHGPGAKEALEEA